MEQHGSELDDQDQGEEEHKYETNWLKLEILLGDVNLKRSGGKVLAKIPVNLQNSQQIINLMKRRHKHPH
jgi:hypothetical protein